MSNRNRERNYEDLQLLADYFTRPEMSVKFLNTVYAIRNSWAARGHLIDREKRMLASQAERFAKLEDFLPKPVVSEEPEAKPVKISPKKTTKKEQV